MLDVYVSFGNLAILGQCGFGRLWVDCMKEHQDTRKTAVFDPRVAKVDPSLRYLPAWAPAKHEVQEGQAAHLNPSTPSYQSTLPEDLVLITYTAQWRLGKDPM